MRDNVSALEEIEALRGMDEFKALARKLNVIARNARLLPSSGVVKLPAFLFAAAPGVGITTALRLLSRQLSQLDLFRFVGDVKFFEWVLDADAFRQGGSFEKLLRKVDEAAGFYGDFRGVVCVDISAWEKEMASPGFRRLLEFADDMYGKQLFVFLVPMMSDERLAPVQAALSAQLPLETVRMPYPEPRVFLDHLREALEKRGFSLADGANDILCDTLERAYKADGFDGFQTISNLMDEIILQKCSDEGMNGFGIEPAHLRFITGKNGWLARVASRGKRGRIGFAGEFAPGAEGV